MHGGYVHRGHACVEACMHWGHACVGVCVHGDVTNDACWDTCSPHTWTE